MALRRVPPMGGCSSAAVGWALLLLTLVTDAMAVECYACAYIPGAESQPACSDPWSWARSRFNLFTGPPKRQCEEACLKTVIDKPGQWSAVLRTCGAPCNETRIGSTLTTCCVTDLCNAATAVLPPTCYLLWALVIITCVIIISLDVR